MVQLVAIIMKRLGKWSFSAVLVELAVLTSCGLVVVNPASGRAPIIKIRLTGKDFQGGAGNLYGTQQFGERVNYVYAQSTGGYSSMHARFEMGEPPDVPSFLHLKARDDDGTGQCRVLITLNGKTFFEGPNGFPEDQWGKNKWAIPAGLLKSGSNELTISNSEPSGQVGMPPWFMVARCAIAPEDYVDRRKLEEDFHVILPKEKRPLPEPLPSGKEPGFKIRGIKGWQWRPGQYLSTIPVLAQYKMNFLMNDYGNLCDIENYPWGDPRCNRWWEDLPDWKIQVYEDIIRTCQEYQIQFCFSMNPNILTERIVDYDSAEDLDLLWKHYRWAQNLGVKWFNISLDDITQGIDASGQAKVVNEIYRRLRTKDPEAKMIFCPTYYWDDGTGKDQQPYLEVLAKELDSEIHLFWTGDFVVGPVTREAAETFKRISKHPIILWDNYPVNDNWPTMHLGPVMFRDRDLCEVLDGYMSNPMCTQNEGNRIPLLTCADYAYNPWAYDPARSIGQAILHLADRPEQQSVLKDLVEVYPGMLLYGEDPGFNSVREQYLKLVAEPHSHFVVSAYKRRLENLLQRMNQLFPERYGPEKKVLADDIDWLNRSMAERYEGTE